ncbi:MAG: DUF6077 domain-containing protein [Bacteroidales bacterium]|nr:DUF6077 domain-containing protein [Lachnoclostridium sp.]MCM1383445.1 DUF6077 domain-containing protein [Lachnoclostridium sp.]MCM1464294.1 DUF6077 domain-containing protein [Bacteroidales bacterium]
MELTATILQLFLWEIMIPVVVGTLFLSVCNFKQNLIFWWISGQMLLWAVFQLLCVPAIWMQTDFEPLAQIYTAVTGILLITAAVLFIRRKGWKFLYFAKNKGTKEQMILWGIFGALLLFQLIQAVRMVYADGDDAYFVALTTITNNANTMYRKLPYTGGSTDVDIRHGLAPFPVWISHLAQISGLKPVTTAHIAVPLMLVAMTYGIFYLLGEKLFRDRPERIPFFLVMLELLVLFGDYSFYTAENFMIARSRQGKAALGNLIVPMLFLLLILLFEWLEAKKKVPVKYWLLLGAVMTTACLCSTMGALLGCMLLGTAGICGAIGFKKWDMLLPLFGCCLPCILFAAMYLSSGQ